MDDENLEIQAELEKQASAAPGFERVAELFTEDEPEWNCLCCTIVKKTAVETIGKFILFLGMIAYIVYQLGKYFDDDENRDEIVDIKTVDAMPMAFIYVDLFQSNETNCSLSFGFWNGSSYTASYYQEWEDFGDPSDWTISEMLDYVDDNGCEPRYVKYDYELSCILFVFFIFILIVCSFCFVLFVRTKK